MRKPPATSTLDTADRRGKNMKLIAENTIASSGEAKNGSENVVTLANDADPRALDLNGVTRVDLHFPKFTDGRAFSQAFLLRRRLGFQGDIRATGDVLVDQLQQMARTGFTEAVLRADQNLAHGQKLLGHYAGFYQGDAVHTQPHFSASTAGATA
jgi:uncharacterized protein (DUF934 family)